MRVLALVGGMFAMLPGVTRWASPEPGSDMSALPPGGRTRQCPCEPSSRVETYERARCASGPSALAASKFEGHIWEMTGPAPKLPPAWFIHTFWRVHRALHRISGGRFLWTTASKRGWGAMRLTTIGRRSGRARDVIVGYIEDGPDLVALAMNGWDEGHPAWWLNLKSQPDAVVRLAHQQPRSVRARPALGEERDRLWRRWADVDVGLDTYADRRSVETPVVVFEPRGGLT
jgi:F420H(2)-dependent quinone reductase